MFYCLLSKNREIKHLDRGMAQPSIRQDELLDIEIKTPKDLEEQDTGLLILGNDVMKTSNIITGEKFVNRITEDANIVADGSFKNKIVKLRYGY